MINLSGRNLVNAAVSIQITLKESSVSCAMQTFRRNIFFPLLLLVQCSAFYSFAGDSDTTLVRLNKIASPKKRVQAYCAVIENCWRKGDYSKGLIYGKKALKIAQTNADKKGQADVLNNIGIIYDYQGKDAAALKCLFKSLRLFETVKEPDGIAYVCSNIGLIYADQKNYKEALRFHKRSLKIRQEMKFESGISASYNNIGIVYMYQENYDDALINYFKSAIIDKRLGDNYGLADTYTNVGVCYMRKGMYDSSAYYFKLTLPIRESFDDKMGIANSYNNIGSLYKDMGNYDEARKWLDKGIALGKQIGANEIVQYGYETKSKLAEKEGNYWEALEHYKRFIRIGKIITNTQHTREQTQAEMQYSFDKKQAKQKYLQQKKEFTSKVILWSVIILVVIISIFSISLYKRWKIAHEQQVLIEEKNQLLQHKNREILDSISYAKRIQAAILPPEKLVKEFLMSSFILYQPKDIVAGDFYWMEATQDTIIFAAADCTGHGVPGALVSVMCYNALNRSVREYGIRQPGEILDKTRDIIIEEFAKSEDDVNDGMDISLCAFNTETLELLWSGANNPLWIIRNGSNEVTEIKANKQPIGRYSNYESFQTHTFQMQPGDQIYLFTDGFYDQFGGMNSKKFKARNMKDLLLSIRDHQMDEQKRLLLQAFEAWKGDLEQVDDVCVLGIRV